MKLSAEIINFFTKQKIVTISTFSDDGRIHCAVKGIVGIEEKGRVFIIDLFKHWTYKNLKANPTVSITSVNEHEFKGFTLQGKAKIVLHKKIEDHIVQKWEDRFVKRISDRMISSVQKGVKSKVHHEAAMPYRPEYLIEIDVENIIDLTPPKYRKKRA